MKKLLLLTLAIVTLTSLVYSQGHPTHLKNGWEEANLKGKVKSFTESKYGAEDRFGEIQKKESSLYSKETYKYDDKGNEIEENTYNADGSLFFVPVFQEIVKNHESLSSTIIIKYDDKGNRIEENIYKVIKGDSINGQVVGGGVSNYTITYKYDDKGNKIEAIWCRSDGSLFEKETYKYEFDEKGNWIKKISFRNQIGNIKEREYEYYE